VHVTANCQPQPFEPSAGPDWQAWIACLEAKHTAGSKGIAHNLHFWQSLPVLASRTAAVRCFPAHSSVEASQCLCCLRIADYSCS
jgi:hypothetical protein